MFKKYITLRISEVIKTARNNGVGKEFSNTCIYINDYPFDIMFDGDIFLHKKDRVKIIEFYTEDNVHKKRDFLFIV